MELTNFETINTIGLLSNPKNLAELNEVDKIALYFQEHGKQVFPFIYLNKQIENNSLTENIGRIGFGVNKFNWFGRPKKNIDLTHFIEKEFDILVDLSFSESYSLQSVFVQSKARLKIMPTSDLSRKFADLMLEVSDSHDKLNFAKELTHYLEIINKDKQ